MHRIVNMFNWFKMYIIHLYIDKSHPLVKFDLPLIAIIMQFPKNIESLSAGKKEFYLKQYLYFNHYFICRKIIFKCRICKKKIKMGVLLIHFWKLTQKFRPKKTYVLKHIRGIYFYDLYVNIHMQIRRGDFIDSSKLIMILRWHA